MHEQAATIANRKSQGRVANDDGVLVAVADEGGRHQMSNIVLNLQHVARDLGREGAAKVEAAAAGAERALTLAGLVGGRAVCRAVPRARLGAPVCRGRQCGN